MSMKNLYTEARPGEGRAGGTKKEGTHRDFPSDCSDPLLGNKWGKENNKFFGDFGSPECVPCTQHMDPMNQVMQYKQDPNPRNS